MPITIEGTPFRTSAVNRTTLASVPPRPNSARKIPAAIPIGTPRALPTASRMPVPRMALAMPPPISPGPVGIFVKKARFSELAPLRMRYPKMATSGATTSRVLRIAIPVARWLVTVRRSRFAERNFGWLLMSCSRSGDSRRCAASYGPYQQTGKGVHDYRHNKQREADFDKRTQVSVIRRLAEFIRNDACHAVARGQQILHDV